MRKFSLAIISIIVLGILSIGVFTFTVNRSNRNKVDFNKSTASKSEKKTDNRILKDNVSSNRLKESIKNKTDNKDLSKETKKDLHTNTKNHSNALNNLTKDIHKVTANDEAKENNHENITPTVIAKTNPTLIVKSDSKVPTNSKPSLKCIRKNSQGCNQIVKTNTISRRNCKSIVKPNITNRKNSKTIVKPNLKENKGSNPLVKPNPKNSKDSKPEVKPNPKDGKDSKPTVKPNPKDSKDSKPTVKPNPKDGKDSKPAVKPNPKDGKDSKPTVKPNPKDDKDSKTNKLVAHNRTDIDDIIKNSVKDLKTSVKIDVSKYKFNNLDFNNYNNLMVLLGGHDFGKPSVSASYNSTEIVLNFKYRKDINTVKQQKLKTEQEVQKVINKIIKPGMSKFEKELAIHDYIVKTTDYDIENYRKGNTPLEDHTAYGALVLHKAVCEGYSKAMHLLLEAAGVNSKYVTGTSKSGGGHAWNMVQLDDGQWYNVDSTWDDPVSDRPSEGTNNGPVMHKYFNLTDAELNKDHIRGKFEQQNFPKCTATKYSYDNMNVPEYNSDGSLIPLIKNDQDFNNVILDVLKNKTKVMNLRFKENVTMDDLFKKVSKVSNGKYGYGLSVSMSDSKHANLTFKW